MLFALGKRESPASTMAILEYFGYLKCQGFIIIPKKSIPKIKSILVSNHNHPHIHPQNQDYTIIINDNHPHLLQNRQAEMPKATAPSTAPVATPPTAQCKRLARDCVMHALFRVGIP